MKPERWKQVLATATADRLRELVLELAPKQPAASRNTVPVSAIFDALAPDLLLEGPALRTELESVLRAAIQRAVEKVPDMTFVETDG